MIKRTGNVFDTAAFWIAHGCNVDGVMGAGVAKTVREQYPVTYESYVKQCMGGNYKPGDCFGIYEKGKVILNLATQDRPGPNARYEWVFNSLRHASKSVRNSYWHRRGEHPVIAMPMIGAGIGGLNWEKVETLVKAVEILQPDVEFEVWKYA